MRYVALLRGINVGGNNKVPMAALRELLAERGFTGVESYIASGNVLLTSELSDPAEVATRFEELLQEGFGVRYPGTGHPPGPVSGDRPGGSTGVDQRHRAEVGRALSLSRGRRAGDHHYPRATGRDRPRNVRFRGRSLEVSAAPTRRAPGSTGSSATKIYRNLTIRNVNTVRKLAHMLTEG
jgi:uncharacterized protein (DUF1697 family)